MTVVRIEKRCKKPKRPSLHILDSEFSKWIRKRDNYTCQRCGKKYPTNSSGLHNSHFIGRANRYTRWDPDNCDALCNGCHQYLETHKATYYREWKYAQLGHNRFWDFIQRSKAIKKWTPEELIELRASWKTGS